MHAFFKVSPPALNDATDGVRLPIENWSGDFFLGVETDIGRRCSEPLSKDRFSDVLGGVTISEFGSCGGVIFAMLRSTESSISLLLSPSFSTNRKLCSDESDDDTEEVPDRPEDPLLPDEAT